VAASISPPACVEKVTANTDHHIDRAGYSDAFASVFIARINPEIFRRRSIASAV
jgi:hypothetical protein